MTAHDKMWIPLLILVALVGCILPWPYGLPQMILASFRLGQKTSKYF